MQWGISVVRRFARPSPAAEQKARHLEVTVLGRPVEGGVLHLLIQSEGRGGGGAGAQENESTGEETSGWVGKRSLG